MEPSTLTNAVSKAVGSALGKLLGSAVGSWWKRRSLLRTINAIKPSTSNLELNSLIGDLDDGDIRRVNSFFDSPEFHAFSVRVVAGLVKSSTPKKATMARESQAEELYRLLSLCAQVENAGIAKAIVDQLINDAAQLLTDTHVSRHLPKQAVSPLVQSLSIRSVDQRHNISVLDEIVSINKINAFEKQARDQIVATHSKIRLPHSGATRMIPYADLYVDPELIYPGTSEITSWLDYELLEGDGDATITDAFETSNHIVVLGDPGGGKSTLSIKTLVDIATEENSPSIKATLPVLVVLRDYAQAFSRENVSLVEWIESTWRSRYQLNPPDGAAEYCLLNGRAFVVMDGLDELIDTSLREQVVMAVHAFVNRFPSTPVLVTSRRIGYDEAPLDSEKFEVLRLGEFDEMRVREYAQKWFRLADTIEDYQRDDITSAFLRESAIVSDLRVNPLMLSLLCSIYCVERYIPRNRPDVYEQCAVMLFERWDTQRNIKVPLPFDAHVRNSMYALALWMYRHPSMQEGLSRRKLETFVTDYLLEKRFDIREDAENAAIDFVKFCTGRAWVMTDVGSNPSQPLYGFTHRTFLEYFAATHLVRTRPSGSGVFEYLKYYIAHAEWDVLAQLSVQILSSNVDDGADQFINLLIAYSNDKSGRERRNVASFCARSLEFVVPRPKTIRNVVELCIEVYLSDCSPLEHSEAAEECVQIVGSLLNVAEEISSQVSKHISILIENAIAQNPQNYPAILLACYPEDFMRRSMPSYAIQPDRSIKHINNPSDSLLELVNHTCIQMDDPPFWIDSYLAANGIASPRMLETKRKLDCLFVESNVLGINTPSVCRWLMQELLVDPLGERLEERLGKHWLEEFYQLLIRIPPPWVTLTENCALTWVLPDNFSSSQNRDRVQIRIYVMIAAFYTEASRLGKDSSDKNSRPDGRTTLRYARTIGLNESEALPEAEAPAPDEILRYLDFLGVDKAGLNIIDEWLHGRIQLLSNPFNK